MSGCLLFDSDGTLVDSELLNCEALAAELGDSGISETASDLMTRYRGWNFHEVLTDIQQRYHVQLDPFFTGRFRERARDHFSLHLQPVAGIEAALNRLDQPKCVASNAPLPKLRHVLEITGLGVHFSDRLYSAYTIGSWKPSPDLFLYAAAEMGYAAEQCIVIEDSEVGVEAANRAGMQVVLYDPDGRLQNLAVTVTLTTMSLLPEVVADLC